MSHRFNKPLFYWKLWKFFISTIPKARIYQLLNIIVDMKKKDVLLLERTLRFCFYTGVCLCFQKNKRKNPILFFLIIVFSLMGAFSSMKFYLDFFKVFDLASIGLVFYGGMMMIAVAFNILSLINVYSQNEYWTFFFKEINSFDFMMEEGTDQWKVSVFNYYLVFSILSIFILITRLMIGVSDVQFQTNRYCKMVSYIYSYNNFFEIMVTSLILWNIFKVLQKRLISLKRRVTQVFLSITTFKLFWNTEELKTSYLLLFNIIKRTNRFFGLRILFLLAITVFEVLAVLQHTFLSHNREKPSNLMVIFALLGQMISLLVSFLIN